MNVQKSTFLLDIRLELSDVFTDEIEITANSKGLFENYLNNISKNDSKSYTKDKRTKSAQKQQTIKKNILRRCPRGVKQYGKSILLKKPATEITSIMKTHSLNLHIKNKSRSDADIGTICVPWTKSFIEYLKNITGNPRLSPVVYNEKFIVMNAKNNVSLGTIFVTVKLMSLASNIYKFISNSKNNARIYRNLFSNPQILERENSLHKTDCVKATEKKFTTDTNCSSNKSEKTFNIIESTQNNFLRPAISTHIESTNNEKSNSLENLPFKMNIQSTGKISYQLELTRKSMWKKSNNHLDATKKNRTYCINCFTLNKDIEGDVSDNTKKIGRKIKTTSFQKYGHTPQIALPVVNFKSQHHINSKPEISEVNVTSCHNIACNSKILPPKLSVSDNYLHLSSSHNQCCSNFEQRTFANLKFDEHPCYCTCECKFEFIRETTYCNICGGYEDIGEEFVDARAQDMPMPCPIYHKLVEKNKLRSRSSSGSLRRRKGDGSLRSIKNSKIPTSKISEKQIKVQDNNGVKPQYKKELKRKKLIKRKQIDYSYKTPHAGHGDCFHPCTRSAILECNVPKSMGWFWTADDVHGLEYRPNWRPGAAEKHVVNLLQMARHPQQILSKKKNKELTKIKRPLKRPLLVVHKKDGEFTVTMETMKEFMKPREIYEHPYEDKPVLTYAIGRTDEENKEREKQKLKKQRRLEREQRTYIQGAFKNMCQEVCLKTCQQALGILPEAEDKQGLCSANATWVEPENLNASCACSENTLSVTDADSDEWILEFTPPNAFFDPSRKGKKVVKTEMETQNPSRE